MAFTSEDVRLAKDYFWEKVAPEVKNSDWKETWPTDKVVNLNESIAIEFHYEKKHAIYYIMMMSCTNSKIDYKEAALLFSEEDNCSSQYRYHISRYQVLEEVA